MRILIITQKVDENDDVLGFFHDWLTLFSKKAEQVTVVSLGVGTHHLPENVEVLSLGKEFGTSTMQRTLRFYWYIFSRLGTYEAVLVHMNPIYIVLAGPLWRLFGKRLVLWYTHRQVGFELRIATFFSNVVMTAAKESFRLASKKIRVVGHGILTSRFTNPYQRGAKFSQPLRIISVGRITPIKNLETLIKALSIVREKSIDARVRLVGAPAVEQDFLYQKKLEGLIEELHLGPYVEWVGSVPNKKIPPYLWESDVSVNLAPTGGIDKAVLESMAAGSVVLVSNEAFRPYFANAAEDLIFKQNNEQDLAEKIVRLNTTSDLSHLRAMLMRSVQQLGSVDGVTDAVMKELAV